MIGNRYVAMIDILGFKNMMAEKGLRTIVNIIRELIDKVEKYESSISLSRRDVGGWKTRSVEFHFDKIHFSDTIICWTKPFNNDDLDDEYLITKSFLSGIAHIIFWGFIKDIPLRVGIGFGESYIDIAEGIIAGQAIIDAYEAEKVQEWVGGAFHPNCAVHHNCNIERISKAHGSHIIPYQVPIKKDAKLKLEYALDWTSSATALAIIPGEIPGELKIGPNDNQEVLEKAFYNYLNNNIESEIKLKYKNAQDYYKYQFNRRPKKIVS